ncbi:MAG TPA: hypothetical protein PLO65_13800, partial [Caulobacter sp.]|nr:hypothetical protein [Caulobacter sp.]
AARAVFDEMIAAGEKPNVFVASSIASRLETIEQATELRDVLRAESRAGTTFYQAAFARLCRQYAARPILNWALGDGKGLPFQAFDAAISTYRRRGDLDSAFLIAAGFPYLEASRTVFRAFGEQARAYLEARFEGGVEPHIAARALGVVFAYAKDTDESLRWFDIALRHEMTPPARVAVIQAEIDRVRLSEFA